MTKLIIADDHKVFRDGIVSILEDIADIQVVGEAEDGRQVLELLKTTQPDVILMDISMNEAGGIETTQLIKKDHPNIRVLALSMHNESEYILKMIEAGAMGYLLKDAGSEEVIQAIRQVAKGKTFYSQDVSSVMVAALTQSNKQQSNKDNVALTRREREVLQLIVEEYSNPEIAEKLFISIRTVDTHRRNLLEKTGAKNTAGLVKFAIKRGIGM